LRGVIAGNQRPDACPDGWRLVNTKGRRHMRSRHLRAWTLAAAALSFAVAACGDDDDAAEDTTSADTALATTPATAASTTSQPSTTTASSAASTTAATDSTVADSASAGATERFCSTVVETGAVASAGPDVDFESATEDEITAAMEDFSTELLPLLDELATSAPDEIADDLETIDSALRSGLETGEDVASDPEFMEADRNINEYVGDNCGFEVYDISGVEYAFENVPDSIEAGIAGFNLVNEGNEVHELVLFRIDDDVDLTIEELLELPEDESQEMVEFMDAAFAEPGASDMFFRDLRPGRYGMLCFIPVGTTDMSDLEDQASGEAGSATTGNASATTGSATADTGSTSAGGQQGPPHFTQGMIAEFEVTEAGDSTSPSTTSGSDSSAPSTTSDDSDTSTPTTTSDSGSTSTTTSG
jgi:hypothetical protein